jgi:hypothetical protein
VRLVAIISLKSAKEHSVSCSAFERACSVISHAWHLIYNIIHSWRTRCCRSQCSQMQIWLVTSHNSILSKKISWYTKSRQAAAVVSMNSCRTPCNMSMRILTDLHPNRYMHIILDMPYHQCRWPHDTSRDLVCR